jgi:hypothetical protein
MEFSTAPSALGSIHLSWFSGRPSLAGPSTTLVIQPSSVDSGQVSTAGLNFTVPQVSTAGLNFTVHQVSTVGLNFTVHLASITAVLRMEEDLRTEAASGMVAEAVTGNHTLPQRDASSVPFFYFISPAYGFFGFGRA